MSDDDRWRPVTVDLEPADDTAVEAPDVLLIEAVTVCAATSEKDQPPSAVVVMMKAVDFEVPIAIQMDTADAVDELIGALSRHRVQVFGEWRQG